MRRSLGNNVQHLREQQGLSQEDLAARADVSRSTIQNIEAGRREPRAASLRRIARALGTDIASLTRNDPEPADTTQRPNLTVIDTQALVAHLTEQIEERREDLRVLDDLEKERRFPRGTIKLIRRTLRQEIERLEDQLSELTPVSHVRPDIVVESNKLPAATNGDG